MVMVSSHGYGIFRKTSFFLINPNKVAPDIHAQILHLVACLDKTGLMALIHTYVIKASLNICWHQWRIEASRLNNVFYQQITFIFI